ncbi:MAG: hypothetical protein PHP53_23950 [Prolixibacteraceae bacterium]|nr:hypothetical protein [Prolixibacteraceae bacterium]
MKYMEALCLSSANAMAKAMNKLIKEEDYISFLATHVAIAKPIKRYLNNQAAAEEYAEKLGSYSIKDVDNYLKSLKEEK